MMKVGTFALALGGLLLLTAIPREASAAACGGFASIVADGRVNGPDTIDTTGDLRYTFWVVGGKSYSAEVNEYDYNDNVTVTVGAVNDICPAADGPGVVSTSGRDPIIDQGSGTGRRVSFTASTTGFVIARVGVSAGSHPVTFIASETTQFSPAWSTFSSFDTFYSFYNTTNGSCTVTLTLVDTGGTIRSNVTAAVASGRTAATNTAALGTARNMAGTAFLTHNCPPGGIFSEAAIANFSISPTPYFQFVHFQPTRDAAH